MKIIDLNNYVNKFSDKSHENLKKIEKKYGNTIILKNKDIEIKANFFIETSPFNKKIKYYCLRDYNAPTRGHSLIPFDVIFMDLVTGSTDNGSCYIRNIHKMEDVSGTQIMETLIAFFKLIKIKNVTLHDGTHVTCNGRHELDLSYFKLLQKGITFYQKFGFKFDTSLNPSNNLYFSKKDNIEDYAHDIISKIQKIKISTIKKVLFNILDLISKIIKNQDFENVKFQIYNNIEPYELNKSNNEQTCINMVTNINSLLFELNKHNNFEMLIDFLEYTFINDCSAYRTFEALIMFGLFYSISYEKKKYVMNHLYLFKSLETIRNIPVRLTIKY